MRNIQLREAKERLSAVVDDAVEGKPSVITRHGRRDAVVLGYEQWKKLSSVPSLGQLLMAAPVEPSDIPARNRKGLRSAKL
ncbi:MAG: type II toxin-antitoxin system Phd/YefM family antitoxin [Alphaproteobacteria bacterium]|nr:type II toxin-antitoxin system Phd/YefM family antitoxin [Alphaproteobacteria bacterium]